jgi:hypothetical protein
MATGNPMFSAIPAPISAMVLVISTHRARRKPGAQCRRFESDESFERVNDHTRMAGTKQISTPIGIVQMLQNLSISDAGEFTPKDMLSSG